MKTLYQYRGFGSVAMLLVVLALSGCGGTSTTEDHTVTPADKPDPEVVAATNGFGLNMLQKLVVEKPAANVFASPTSIALALAMVYNGAAGDTQTAMSQAMGLHEFSPKTINDAFLAMRNSLALPADEAQLTIANAIWTKQGLTFKPDFLTTNHDFYGANAATLDFGSPEAAGVINDWISAQTQGKIPKLVSPEEVQSLLMFLADAVYFKGKWTVPFDVAATQDAPFTKADGTQQPLPMMFQDASFNYLEQDGVQVVELPYGKGRMSMIVALPAKQANLAAFAQSLTPGRWQGWLDGLARHPGVLKLPRFKVEYEAMLNDTLTQLGMGVAFDPDHADFSGMIDTSKLWLGFVKHKTF
ncbi:MAG: serpin family protein, partial [Armatimonadota bacterium]